MKMIKKLLIPFHPLKFGQSIKS